MDVHRAAPRNLNEVLSGEAERVGQGDWTVVCERKRYQLDRQHEALRLVRRKVIVRTLRTGRVQLVYRGKRLKWQPLPEDAARKPQPAKKPRPMKTKAPHAPPASHPWRREGVDAGGEFWKRIKAQDRAARLALRASRGNPTTRNHQPRGHSLLSSDANISKEF